MRRRSELLLHHVFAVPGDLERRVHHFWEVVADRSGGKLYAVAHHVVLERLDLERRLRLKSLKTSLRHRERVVREDDLAGLGVLLEEREVDDPAEAVYAVLADVVRQMVGDVGADEPREAVALGYTGLLLPSF